MTDSMNSSPTLLLIFKECAGKYHLLNSPGLPIKTVTPLINSINSSPFVDTTLLMSVTDVLKDARFSGYSYLSSFYASKPAHVYVLLEKHDPIEDEYETVARPFLKIPESSVGVQTDLKWPVPPSLISANTFPSISALETREFYPGGHFYKYISPTSSRQPASENSVGNQQHSHPSSPTIGLSQSACDWEPTDGEWDATLAASQHDEWCDAGIDDAASVAATEPYEEGFYEVYYGKTPETTNSVTTPGDHEWRPYDGFAPVEKQVKSTAW